MDVKSQGTFFHEVLRGRDPMAVSREMGLRLEALSGESLAIRKDFTEKRSRIGGCGDICEAQIRLVIGGETFTGAIDRLIPSEEGWKIVDYKRAGGNAKEDEELDKEHSIQLAIYRQAAGSALQADGSCYLYLMRDRAIKEMPSSPEKLQMVADLAKDIRAFADSERMPIGEKEDGGE
jgi:RecB family exonuclease